VTDHIPPHSLDAEQALLGAALLTGDTLTLSKLASAIPTSMIFYHPQHRTIFDTIMTLYQSHEPVDITTVALELDRCGILEKSGGRTYITELAAGMASAANLDQYLGVVLRKHHQRTLIEAGISMIDRAYRDADDPEILADETAAMLLASSIHSQRQSPRLISSFMPGILETIDLVHSGKRKPGIMTGFSKLDEMTAGLQAGELTIIAGRPQNGKTALLNCVASNIVRAGYRALMFSAEMAGEQLALRSLCAEAKLNSVDLRHGRVEERDWTAMTEAIIRMDGWQYRIDDRPAVDVSSLMAETSRAKSQGQCDVVFIDYLQLVTSSRKFFSRREMIGYVALALKNMAKDLALPVVVAAQLSRETEKRRDPKPRLADLAESGEIERHADNVVGIFRPELYATKKDGDRFKGVADLLVLKQRNGPQGTVELFFDAARTLFVEMVPTLNPNF